MNVPTYAESLASVITFASLPTPYWMGICTPAFPVHTAGDARLFRCRVWDTPPSPSLLWAGPSRPPSHVVGRPGTLVLRLWPVMPHRRCLPPLGGSPHCYW